MKTNTKKRQVTQMAEKIRKTGIDILGDAPWGTHFCQFYQTKEDLIDILVPYFKAGLENNEFCMWVTSEPLSEEEAIKAMRKVVPNFDQHLKRGQIDIVPHTEWYLKDGSFNLQRVLNAWVDKLNFALAKGYDGIRVTGNTAWLKKGDWRNFADYEEEVNNVIGKYRMMAICTYWLEKCGASEVIDVVSNHQFALIRREGEWERIESSECKKTEEALRKSEEKYRDLIENINDFVYTLDPHGKITSANKSAFEAFESSPDDLYRTNFKDLIPEEYQAQALKDFQTILECGEIKNATTVLKSKTGREIWVEFNSTAIVKDGKVVGTRGIARDITERKRAEEVLRESEEFSTSLLNNSPNPIVVINPDTSVRYVNPALKKLTGFSSADVIGKKAPYLWWTEETLKKTSKDLDKAMCKGANKVEEFFQKKNGERFWVEITSTPVKSNGEFKYYLANWVDITERKKAEEKLREANTIINRSPTVAFTWKNQEGWPIEFVSENVEKLFGYTAEEFMSGKVPYADCVHPDDLKRVAGEVVAFSSEEGRKEFVHQPYRIKTKDGLEKVLHDWTFIVRDEDGKITHYKGIVEDITERKQAEEALEESEERYRNLFENAPFGIYRTTPDGRILMANPAIIRMLGYSSFEELASRNLEKEGYEATYPRSQFKQLIESKGEVNGMEAAWTKSDKSVIFVRENAKVFRDDKGAVLYYEGTAEDITEKKKMEAQLIQAERLTAVGTLAYGIAHEFNNILAGILGNAEFGMGNDNAQEVEECFRVIMENCDRARSVTNSLLALSGQRETKKPRADVTDAVHTVLGLVESELEKQNINVVEKLNPVPEIVCDLGELSQVYLNMITNARDAMRPKGGTLTIETKRTGDNLEIIFTDTGCGIPDNIKSRIFEPFVTTKGALGKSEIPGTGLGLFLSYGIIKKYQGEIMGKSERGQGSKFTIKIPISKNQVPPVLVEADEEKRVDVPQNLNILLIDDEEPICNVVKNFLEDEGHSVVTSLNGRKGLELFKNKAFDLVLSDIAMPDMDGVELISKVKKVDDNVKIIALTGHLAEEQLNRAKKAGADQILVKPFKKEDLYKAVGKALSI